MTFLLVAARASTVSCLPAVRDDRRDPAGVLRVAAARAECWQRLRCGAVGADPPDSTVRRIRPTALCGSPLICVTKACGWAASGSPASCEQTGCAAPTAVAAGRAHHPGSRPSRRRPDLVDRRFAHSEPNQDPWDNALTETFFASLEQELLRRERFHAREQARMRLFRYIESRPPRSAPTSTKPNAIKTTPPTTRRHGNPVTTRPGEDQRSPATRAPTSCRDGNGKPPLAGRARASRWRPCLWGGPVGIPEPILIRGSAVTCGTDSRTSNH